ncbi:MAG: hypothetical protein SNJ73_10095 [Acetobacteraceae bacterium]
MNRGTGAALGHADDDSVHVISRHGRITVQVRPMDGVERNTVRTWNAIGRRAGARALDARAREAAAASRPVAGRRGVTLMPDLGDRPVNRPLPPRPRSRAPEAGVAGEGLAGLLGRVDRMPTRLGGRAGPG